FPRRELIEDLAVLELKVAHQRHRMGKSIGAISVAENRLDSIQLLAPEIGLRPAMLQALPEDRPLRALRQHVIKSKMFDFVAAQNRFDHTGIALRQNIA